MSYTGIGSMFDTSYRSRLRRGLPKLGIDSGPIVAEPRPVGLLDSVQPRNFNYENPPIADVQPPPELYAAQNRTSATAGGLASANVRQSYAPYLQGPAPLPGPQPWKYGTGFKGRLLAALTGFGLGGPAGAIASAINPKVASKLAYDQIERPQLEAEQQKQIAANRFALQAAHEASADTGYNPITGAPSLQREGLEQRAQAADLQARGLAERLRLTELQNAALNEYRDRSLSQRADIAERGFQLKSDQNKSTLSGKAAKTIQDMYVTGAGKLGPDSRQALVNAGVPLEFVNSLPETFDPKFISTAVDTEGNVTAISVGRTSGDIKSTAVVPGAGKPSTTGENKPYSDKDAYDDALAEYDKIFSQLDARTKRRIRISPNIDENPFKGKSKEEWVKEKAAQLKEQFGKSAPARPALTGAKSKSRNTAKKIFSAADLPAAAAQYGMSEDEVRKNLEAHGYTIQ